MGMVEGGLKSVFYKYGVQREACLSEGLTGRAANKPGLMNPGLMSACGHP